MGRPEGQSSWQVRRLRTPSTVARQSKQMPMPQSAVRGWPVVDLRHGTPAVSRAALTTVPACTLIEWPLTVMVTESGKNRLRARHALRQVWSGVDGAFSCEQMIDEQPRGCRRQCDAQALEAGEQVEGWVVCGTDQREVIGSRCAEAGPDACGRERSQLRHVLIGASEHGGDDARVGSRIFPPVLTRRADEQLPGDSRLDVKCDRVGDGGMRALQIAELNELMTHESSITVGDHEVPFAFFKAHPWNYIRIDPGCYYDVVAG